MSNIKSVSGKTLAQLVFASLAVLEYGRVCLHEGERAIIVRCNRLNKHFSLFTQHTLNDTPFNNESVQRPEVVCPGVILIFCINYYSIY